MQLEIIRETVLRGTSGDSFLELKSGQDVKNKTVMQSRGQQFTPKNLVESNK